MDRRHSVWRSFDLEVRESEVEIMEETTEQTEASAEIAEHEVDRPHSPRSVISFCLPFVPLFLFSIRTDEPNDRDSIPRSPAIRN